ncbi:XkdX family protein [Paucisalibacillus globulus]|nr:XkdX family protein [Paucisalibacillus globulus]
MEFWDLAYKRNWVTKEELKFAVITEENPYGEITPAEYEVITGDSFIA